MEELQGRTAVVTGAGSGIGRALAARFAASGMSVVAADVDGEALDETVAALEETGAAALGVRTDVSDSGSVDALAEATRTRFGDVHVLCNNAGVGGSWGMIHELSTDDWEWVLGINLWGVIYGLQAFLPGMLAHGDEGHVVNTASMAGFRAAAFASGYDASKAAVVSISESLYHELAATGARIGVSVLCPGAVNTNGWKSVRNLPAVAGGGTEHATRVLAAGIAPAEAADKVVEGIHERRLYVITHPAWLDDVETRMRAILAQANPEPLDNRSFVAGSKEPTN